MSRDKLRPDVNETAYGIVQAATGQGPKPKRPGEGEPNAEAVKRGRKGGRRGGKARARKLTPRRRAQIARRAANARWKRQSDK